MGSTENFWKSFSIKGERDQPGNPKSQEELPSTHAKITPHKAGVILKDGSVRGHKLTPKQKGFFGAIKGKESK